MHRNKLQAAVPALALLALSWGSIETARAQGCIAAHSPQSMVGALCGSYDSAYAGDKFNIHNLQLNIGFREFNSFRHFIGTNEQKQREAMHTQIRNHQDFWDVGLAYYASPRWTFVADVPFAVSTRNQLYPPKGIYDVAGIGDMTVGAQAWVLRPPTESHANVQFGAALKIPTGIKDATGTATLANGQKGKATADQSLQPGDGTWGFNLNTVAYKQLPLQTISYFTGSYLFNPAGNNGVPTFRTRPGEKTMGVTDQYLYRGGFGHSVPKIRGAALSIGGRIEGVPVRNAFGSSNGFRRPGYIISIEPGLMYERRKTMFSVSGPWAMERNRKRSVADYMNNTHGDAAFADYTVLVNVSQRF